MTTSSGPPSATPDEAHRSTQQDKQDGLLPVIKFLQSALAMKAKGEGLHYQHLVAQLLTRDDPETLWRLYLGLCHCVTIISQQPGEFKELIDALFRFDWRANEKIMGAFGGLLSHLISANSTCMVPAMHMLVRSMVLAPIDLDGDGNVDPAALTRQQRVHESLQASLTVVPSGRSKLFGVLMQHYPHRRMRAEILSDYALQALRVVQYAPLIEESVVRLIVERSLEIDVEIKIMDTGEAVVDEEDEESDALFTMDDLVEGAADAKRHNTDEVDEMAEKLDGVMLVVFTYLDQRLTANTPLTMEAILNTPPADGTAPPAGGDGLDEERRKRSSSISGQGVEPVARLLQSLLFMFEETILPTHRSKFVQFVLFFACGRAPSLGYALASKLVDALRDDYSPKLTRQSSVAYLASFLARGSFIEASLLSKAVGAMLEWAAKYLDHFGEAVAMPGTSQTPGAKAFETPVANRKSARRQSWHGSNPPGTASASGRGGMMVPMSAASAKSAGGRGADHKLFYSVCQATFYVMCFRGEELAAMDAIGSQAAIWQRLLTCSLYPLRHCLDTVRREFARLCCGLMGEHLDPQLLEHLEGIADERPEVSQTITIGSGFSFSTPRSSASASNGTWTPSRVTKAGGLGRGSNPLDSFFPFDPYLLRRSHVYVAAMYNTWKVPDHQASNRRRRRDRGSNVATAHNRLGNGAHGSDSEDLSSNYDSENDNEGDGDPGESGGHDAMDASSLSFRDRAGGLRARSSGRIIGKGGAATAAARRDGNRRGARSGERSDESSEEEGSSDGETGGVSRQMEDAHISESMSVTPGSSVAVGSLMGRSLGKAMASSFADDGLAWGGQAAGGSVDDAFFHQDVSPSTSPPLASAMGSRSPSINFGARSRRALF